MIIIIIIMIIIIIIMIIIIIIIICVCLSVCSAWMCFTNLIAKKRDYAETQTKLATGLHMQNHMKLIQLQCMAHASWQPIDKPPSDCTLVRVPGGEAPVRWLDCKTGMRWLLRSDAPDYILLMRLGSLCPPLASHVNFAMRHR
jgi:hypothetical protein